MSYAQTNKKKINFPFEFRPGKNSVSFLCEFNKQSLITGLNAPATNFKELTPGTQYWAKVPADKVPKTIPNQVR
jgi:hypothetical protein